MAERPTEVAEVVRRVEVAELAENPAEVRLAERPVEVTEVVRRVEVAWSGREIEAVYQREWKIRAKVVWQTAV